MKHVLKLIYRNFRKNLTINLINLGGLALSMAVVLMLAAYCYSELTTDLHHDNVDQTFLITNGSNMESLGVHTPAILTDYLKSDVPEIQKAVRIGSTWGATVLKKDDGEVFETETIFADDGFFDLFNYHFIKGNRDNALKQPMSLVIIKSEALRLFGKLDLIGQTVMINNKHLVEISAVVEPPTNNSFLSIKAIVPVSSRPTIQPSEGEWTNWGWSNFQTFVQIKEHSDLQKIGDTIKNMFVEHSKGSVTSDNIILLPLKDIYFSGFDAGWLDFIVLGDKTKVIVLLTIAILILLMAIVNFLNISSYSIKERSLQTGIFKIIGASRAQIFRNNIFESVLFFILSMWIAILLAEILRPVVYLNTGLTYSNHLLLSSLFILLTLTAAIALGVISSLFHATKISSSHPIDNLKKEFLGKNKKSLFRGALVIFQFCAAITLLSFTLLVRKQRPGIC